MSALCVLVFRTRQIMGIPRLNLKSSFCIFSKSKPNLNSNWNSGWPEFERAVICAREIARRLGGDGLF